MGKEEYEQARNTVLTKIMASYMVLPEDVQNEVAPAMTMIGHLIEIFDKLEYSLTSTEYMDILLSDVENVKKVDNALVNLRKAFEEVENEGY